MAQARVAVAKATLAAALIRSDPVRVHQEEIAGFHGLLERAAGSCTVSNVQEVTGWLVEHCLQSAQRTIAFVKYICAHVILLVDADANKNTPERQSREALRQSLHLLYCLTDALHYRCHHLPADDFGTQRYALDAETELLPPVAQSICRAFSAIGSAANSHTRVRRKIDRLVAVWRVQALVPEECLRSITEAVQTGRGPANAGQDMTGDGRGRAGAEKAGSKSQLQLDSLPSLHGDPETPYFDLPAGCFLSAIGPQPGRPVRPQEMKPVELKEGEASTELVSAVDSLLARIHGTVYASCPVDCAIVDVDPVGKKTYVNLPAGGGGRMVGEAAVAAVAGTGSGPVRFSEQTYYGWSPSFCQQVKEELAAAAAGRWKGPASAAAE